MTTARDFVRLLTVEEASVELHIPKWTVWYLLRNGKLPATKLGRRYYIPASALAALEGRAVAEGAERARAAQKAAQP